MKMSYELPPMLDQIRAAGMNPVVEKTCFTYGDTLYNPGRLAVPEHYMRHEECHTVQQAPRNLQAHNDDCSIHSTAFRGIELIGCNCTAAKTNAILTNEAADRWWARYLVDPYFRIDQEAEAFAVQYVFFKNYVNKDRNVAARFLFQLGGLLSSPTYGKIISGTAAQRMIQAAASKVRI